MRNDWDGYCAICASRDYCGDLYLEQGLDQSESASLESLRLCTPCFAVVREALEQAVTRSGESARVHLPDRTREWRREGGCDVCYGEPEGSVFALHLLPDDAGAVLAPIRRLSEHGHHYTLCSSCVQWFREVVDQESATRWGNRRAGDEPATVSHDVHYRIVPVGLDPRDVATLRETVEPFGHMVVDGPGDGRTVVVYLVAAGQSGEAAEFVGGLQAVDRVRTVIVTEAAQLRDAVWALRAGAGDLLVAPVSRQQVLGMLDRLNDQFAVSGRDERTGLPAYYVRPRFGLPCHLVVVQPPPNVDPMDAVILLRRFLRGYDRIGVTSSGDVPVNIYCGDEHIEGVTRRIRTLFGPSYRIEVRDHAAPNEHEPIPGVIDALKPGISASAFFGKRLGKRAS